MRVKVAASNARGEWTDIREGVYNRRYVQHTTVSGRASAAELRLISLNAGCHAGGRAKA